MSKHDETWKIGELARATGLTVRTLHHYDRLGLLSPQSRTEGGHRCYTGSDVQRLHHIVALRSLGITLEDIAAILDGEPDPIGLLRRQLDLVEERIGKAFELRARLLDVLNNLGCSAQPSACQLLQLIENTVALDEPMTSEQFEELKDKLRQQARDLGERDLTALGQKHDTWNSLSHHDQLYLTGLRRRTPPYAADDNRKAKP